MDIKKFAPWNWFKKENEETEHSVPVIHQENKIGQNHYPNMPHTHNDINRLFDTLFQGFGLSPHMTENRLLENINGSLLKPRLDLGATEKNYTISLEMPGVNEKDIHLEVLNDTLTIRGEKKQEKEEKNKNYYRLERSYGSFQRTLSLPQDSDVDHIDAKMKNGVLDITIPRMTLPEKQVKQIEVKYA